MEAALGESLAMIADPEPPAELAAMLRGIVPACAAQPEAVRQHIDRLTKPPGSLGRLEAIAARLARIYGDPPPHLRRRSIFVFAADHGVARHGISAYPSEVTGAMCRNFSAGGAAINAIAGAVGADLVIVDIGVDADLQAVPGILNHKVRRGSRDLSTGPALTREETLSAVMAGMRVFDERSPRPDVVGLGEMGIGNTTAASAVTAALTDTRVWSVVGPGTGIEGDRLDRKREIVRRALARLHPRANALEVLAEVGGLEIAGLVGVVLAAARARRAVVTDGFIATASALAAVRICPAVRDYLFASHRSAEPGHIVQLEALGLRPILDLELRLGEGTGAALALPILEAAAAILREMSTFDSAGIPVSEGPP